MQRFLDTFYLCKYFSWTTFYIYVSQKHFIRNTGGRQFFSVSTSQVYREMNESCICNVWKEKACQLSSRAMCLHCIFFFQLWCLGGWDHPLRTDKMISSNLSWWLWEYLPEHKCIQTISTEQTRCLRFQEAILPESSQVWYRTATALFYTVSKKHLASMIANMSTVLHRDAKGVCPRLTQSASLWSLMIK